MSRAAIFAFAIVVVGCSGPSAAPAPATTIGGAVVDGRTVPVKGVARKIVDGAKAQLKNPAYYTPRYFSISYPGGDIPADRGACVDVVIRALRNAGFDLQKLIHEDMRSHFAEYPRRGDRTDTNIDHRRVPNQRHFFSKFGASLPIRTDGDFAKQWQPGDIVTWDLGHGVDHTGILSDSTDSRGLPWVIHNLSRTAEEDVLTSWTITGHYRYPRD